MNKPVVLLLVLVASACSSVRLKDVKSEKDFSIANYKSFSFYEVNSGGDAIGPNHQENLKRIKEAIVREMGAKGLTLTADNPQLNVNIGVVVNEETQTRETSFTNPGDRTYYTGQRNYTWQSQEVVVGTYRQGSVIVHLVDTKENKMVWQGTAQSVLPDKEKNIPALIDEGIKTLFAKLK